MSAVWRNRLIGLLLAAVIYVADQALKDYIVFGLRLRQVGTIELLPFFDLRWAPNFGVSLGMFAATSMEMRWGLVAVTALIALVVLVWMLRERKLIDVIGLSMILGGAAGNIHDRYNLGYVVDFIDIHFGEWTPFIFNLADASITIGVVIILARALFMGEKPAVPQSLEPADRPAENS